MHKLLLASGLAFFSLLAPAQSKDPILLPDGTSFQSWEDTTQYSQIYYVDQKNTQASDTNPGTEKLPFKTIGKAAQVLLPGQKVIVKEGVYREKVVPKMGGTGNDAMINYEAAPGENVVITGAEILKSKWEQPVNDLFKQNVKEKEDIKNQVWKTKMSVSFFKKGNPFAKINLTSWMMAHFAKSDRNVFNIDSMGQYFALKRGMIFLNGKKLTQVANYRALYNKTAENSFWVEDDGLTVHLRTKDNLDPNQANIEITAREQCFAPEDIELGYIKVKGFVFEKGGNPFPIDQKGLLSTNAGHHWIIEDNIVQWANGIGADIGIGHWTKAKPKISGYHIVRNNTFKDNGICGLAGNVIYNSLIEDNFLERNSFYPVEKYFENASIKLHHNVNTVIQNNKIMNTKFGAGIWMDYGNVNSRCTGNLVMNTNSMFGAIFMEASLVPNLVDNNVVIKSSSSGIYQHDCDSLLVANNLVVNAHKSGIRMSYHPERKIHGKLATMKNNVIASNIIIKTDTIFSMQDTDNIIDYNYIAKKHNALYENSDAVNPNWNKHVHITDMDLKIIPKQNTQTPERIEIKFPKVKFQKNIYQLNQVPGPKGVFKKKNNTLVIPVHQGLSPN